VVTLSHFEQKEVACIFDKRLNASSMSHDELEDRDDVALEAREETLVIVDHGALDVWDEEPLDLDDDRLEDRNDELGIVDQEALEDEPAPACE
jgi:hypothetical protein